MGAELGLATGQEHGEQQDPHGFEQSSSITSVLPAPGVPVYVYTTLVADGAPTVNGFATAACVPPSCLIEQTGATRKGVAKVCVIVGFAACPAPLAVRV